LNKFKLTESPADRKITVAIFGKLPVSEHILASANEWPWSKQPARWASHCRTLGLWSQSA